MERVMSASDFIAMKEEAMGDVGKPDRYHWEWEPGDAPEYPLGHKTCECCRKPSDRLRQLDGKPYYCTRTPECKKAGNRYKATRHRRRRDQRDAMGVHSVNVVPPDEFVDDDPIVDFDD